MTTGKVVAITLATVVGGSWAFHKMKIKAPVLNP